MYSKGRYSSHNIPLSKKYGVASVHSMLQSQSLFIIKHAVTLAFLPITFLPHSKFFFSSSLKKNQKIKKSLWYFFRTVPLKAKGESEWPSYELITYIQNYSLKWIKWFYYGRMICDFFSSTLGEQLGVRDCKKIGVDILVTQTTFTRPQAIPIASIMTRLIIIPHISLCISQTSPRNVTAQCSLWNRPKPLYKESLRDLTRNTICSWSHFCRP